MQQHTQPEVNATEHTNRTALSSRTLSLIICLAVLAGFFLVLALWPVAHETKHITLGPTPTPFAQSILSIQQSTISAIPNQKSLDVVLQTHTNQVTAVQFMLSFDPKIIQNITITAGPFLPTPVELQKKIDYTTGTIFYAIGIPPTAEGVTGNGVIATLQFSTALTQSPSTLLSFTQKTLVAGTGQTKSVLQKADSYTLSLQ